MAEIATWTITPGAQVVGVVAEQPPGLPYTAGDSGQVMIAAADETQPVEQD